MSVRVPSFKEHEALKQRVKLLEDAVFGGTEPEPPEPGEWSPPSWLSKEFLAEVKADILANPDGIRAQHFADMLVNDKSNGGGRRTSRSLFSDPDYISAPGPQMSPDGTSFPTTFGQDAYGQNFTDDCTAIHTLAIRSELDPDPAMAERCLFGAVRILEDWVIGPMALEYVDSQWSDNTKRGALFAGWGWQQLGPALSIIWPSLSEELKAALPEWAWRVFLDKSSSQTAGGTIYDPEDGHWIRGKNPEYPAVTNNGNLLCEVAGSNHLLTYFLTRLHIGLMGGEHGQEIVDQVIEDFRLIAPSCIYYEGDAHYTLGAGWPVSPVPHGWPGENQYDSADEMNRYWFYPPEYISGLSEEIRRDRGHQQMSVIVNALWNATCEEAGLGDWFTNDVAEIPFWLERIILEAEMNNGWYTDVVDEAWANYGGDVVAVGNGSFTPSDWEGEYKVGGGSADHGVHVIDYYLRHKKGHNLPITQALAKRLAGTTNRSSSCAAGVGVIRAANQFTWEALLFSAD